ncbi:hypothetical protein M426DRAFT_18600 [Hypoxylon sp. CI-4A]|nr:hypothetical protein M426DRAFT_18600 [Hypoxylon sp. CI-4A]
MPYSLQPPDQVKKGTGSMSSTSQSSTSYRVTATNELSQYKPKPKPPPPRSPYSTTGTGGNTFMGAESRKELTPAKGIFLGIDNAFSRQPQVVVRISMAKMLPGGVVDELPRWDTYRYDWFDRRAEKRCRSESLVLQNTKDADKRRQF